MMRALAAIFMTLLPLAVEAGDPCPISFAIHDLGAPDWLDRDTLLSRLESQFGWLGVRYDTTEEGLNINLVYDSSPALAAGLKRGDLITAINGEVAKDPEQVDDLFNKMVAGRITEFTITRDDRADIILPAKIGYHDPVVFVSLNAINAQECRMARLVQDRAEDRALLLAAVFKANRGFRCDDAHVALLEESRRSFDGDIYIVRGSRRLLITMPNWGTTCVNIDALDGAALTKLAVVDVLNSIVSGYVKDRFKNP